MSQSLQLNEIRLGYEMLKHKEHVMNECLPDLDELPPPEILKTFVDCITHDMDITLEFAQLIETYQNEYEFSICPRLDVELFSYLCGAKVHMTKLDAILKKIADNIDNLDHPDRNI